jgi:hypothetical protein
MPKQFRLGAQVLLHRMQLLDDVALLRATVKHLRGDEVEVATHQAANLPGVILRLDS